MAKIPEKIDKYSIEELVAEGGMGAVYKAIHPTLNRPVILKKLTLRGNATVTERFKREARLLMDFRNDNIVDVQDHFIQGRSHYIVMEYIDGPSVKDLLDEQRYLDSCTTAYITLHTAIALRYAHRKGVVHRDIKPGNILISRSGAIKLADFGIASARDPETGEDTLTADGTTLGTPAYMAPEQFENSRTVDYRADLYSLGVMMYEMLTGLKPFPGGFTPETIRRIQKGRYKKPRRINPSASPALQRIVTSMIKPRAKSRCGDIDKVIRKLEKQLAKYTEEQIRNRLCGMIREETPAPLKRKKRPVRTAVISVSAIIAGTAFLIGGFCALTNVHKQLLSPAEYGLVRIIIDTSGADSVMIPASSLYVDDGKDIPAAALQPIFIPGIDATYSLPSAMPAGRYRLKTVAGDRIIWTSFTLKPGRQQSGIREIRITASDPHPAELDINFRVHDARTGWDITDSAVLEVYVDGGFVPVNNTSVFSGEVHNFRLSAEGYNEQEWVLRINPAERALRFVTELEPAEAAGE